VKQKQYLDGFAHGFGRVPEISVNRLAKSIEKIRRSVGLSLYRMFEEVLPAESVVRRSGERRRGYDSATTLWAMLSQTMRGSSQRDVVRELQAVDELLGRPVRSGNTGSYAEARGRLSDATVESAHERLAERIEQMTPQEQVRSGRLLSVDATGVQLDDTKANLKYYKYAACQKPGCGFPVMQQVALMDLGSGTVIDAIETAQDEGESPLFEAGLRHHIGEGDVLLADRAYCSFVNIIRVLEAGGDALMRLNSSRNKEALKKSDDVVVRWRRPDFSASPLHLFHEDWEQLPESIEVRLVRYRVAMKGYRTREVLMATTLMEESVDELAALYRRRWEIETEFRHLKTTLGMEHIHVKSPEMAYKQMYVFFIAHNLIRWLMLQAANEHDVDPTRISFKGAVDCMQRWISEMAHLKRKDFAAMKDRMLQILARDIVPKRHDRIEPRRLKKRLKRFTLLTFPRSKYLTDEEYLKAALS